MSIHSSNMTNDVDGVVRRGKQSCARTWALGALVEGRWSQERLAVGRIVRPTGDGRNLCRVE